MKPSTTIIVINQISALMIAISAMIHGAGTFEWNGFYPWVISPYIIFLGIFCLPRSQTKQRTLAGCVASVIVFLLTCWLYIEAMWFSESSTSALVFLFAPIYLFVGGLTVWSIAWFFFTRTLKTR